VAGSDTGAGAGAGATISTAIFGGVGADRRNAMLSPLAMVSALVRVRGSGDEEGGEAGLRTPLTPFVCPFQLARADG